jgi:polyferredoxin
MAKINKPAGLIRYESEENILHNKKSKFNWRFAGYSVVLMALLGVLGILLATRDDVDARILRTAGQLYQEMPGGKISNLFNIKLANKTRKDVPVVLKLENIKGEIQVIARELIVPKESYFQTPFFVKIDSSLIIKRKTPIVLGVYQGDKKIETLKTTFLGPGY